jgi:hypothetical protein
MASEDESTAGGDDTRTWVSLGNSSTILSVDNRCDNELSHGDVVMLNVRATDVHGLIGVGTSKGVLIDLTPPEPGLSVDQQRCASPLANDGTKLPLPIGTLNCELQADTMTIEGCAQVALLDQVSLIHAGTCSSDTVTTEPNHRLIKDAAGEIQGEFFCRL